MALRKPAAVHQGFGGVAQPGGSIWARHCREVRPMQMAFSQNRANAKGDASRLLRASVSISAKISPDFGAIISP